MLVRDPRKRATANEVLQHEWVREGGVAGDNVIEPEVLTRMRGFAAMNKLKKEALKVGRAAPTRANASIAQPERWRVCPNQEMGHSSAPLLHDAPRLSLPGHR